MTHALVFSPELVHSFPHQPAVTYGRTPSGT